MPVITCIEDLKRLYKRRVPRMFFDYCESGSYTEQTFHENVSDFSKLRLRQKVAVDMSDRNISSTMLGQKVTMPVALAPVGFAGIGIEHKPHAIGEDDLLHLDIGQHLAAGDFARWPEWRQFGEVHSG